MFYISVRMKAGRFLLLGRMMFCFLQLWGLTETDSVSIEVCSSCYISNTVTQAAMLAVVMALTFIWTQRPPIRINSISATSSSSLSVTKPQISSDTTTANIIVSKKGNGKHKRDKKRDKKEKLQTFNAATDNNRDDNNSNSEPKAGASQTKKNDLSEKIVHHPKPKGNLHHTNSSERENVTRADTSSGKRRDSGNIKKKKRTNQNTKCGDNDNRRRECGNHEKVKATADMKTKENTNCNNNSNNSKGTPLKYTTDENGKCINFGKWKPPTGRTTQKSIGSGNGKPPIGAPNNTRKCTYKNAVKQASGITAVTKEYAAIKLANHFTSAAGDEHAVQEARYNSMSAAVDERAPQEARDNPMSAAVDERGPQEARDNPISAAVDERAPQEARDNPMSAAGDEHAVQEARDNPMSAAVDERAPQEARDNPMSADEHAVEEIDLSPYPALVSDQCRDQDGYFYVDIDMYNEYKSQGAIPKYCRCRRTIRTTKMDENSNSNNITTTNNNNNGNDDTPSMPNIQDKMKRGTETVQRPDENMKINTRVDRVLAYCNETMM